MKISKACFINLLLAFLLSCLPLFAEKTQQQEEGWTTSGELAYSYSYAKTYLGHKLRLKGWVCKLSFTCGPRHSIEHSVWEKDGKKLQVMIWRIDANRTGYSWGEFTDK
jgi:hypothetical protein